jgi:hypothetical protein
VVKQYECALDRTTAGGTCKFQCSLFATIPSLFIFILSHIVACSLLRIVAFIIQHIVVHCILLLDPYAHNLLIYFTILLTRNLHRLYTQNLLTTVIASSLSHTDVQQNFFLGLHILGSPSAVDVVVTYAVN